MPNTSSMGVAFTHSFQTDHQLVLELEYNYTNLALTLSLQKKTTTFLDLSKYVSFYVPSGKLT